MEWLFENAKQFSDFIALVVVMATGGIWVARRVMLSIKTAQSVLTNQKTFATTQDALVASVADIAKQLKPNGGTSIFDMIRDAYKKSDENNKSLKILTDSVAKMRAYQRAFTETVTDKPVFETDEKGACVYVNMPYTKLAERNSPELLGNGWEIFVHYSDRARVFEEWHDAVVRKHIFESAYKVQSKSGKVYSVKVIAIPVIDDFGNPTAFIGRFDDVKEAPVG